MSGTKNLRLLLRGMDPKVQEGEYIFCSLEKPSPQLIEQALGSFKEEEGMSLILERSIADAHGISYDFISAWITLQVHSSLDAVGLTAAVATVLTRLQVSCNVVAAYYHDHIFVDKADAKKAINALREFSKHA